MFFINTCKISKIRSVKKFWQIIPILFIFQKKKNIDQNSLYPLIIISIITDWVLYTT